MSALDNNMRKANKSKQFSHLSDDEPLYDSVASDDDYAALTPVVQNVRFWQQFLLVTLFYIYLKYNTNS